MEKRTVEKLLKERPGETFVVHNGFFGYSYGTPQDPHEITLESTLSILNFCKRPEKQLLEELTTGLGVVTFCEKNDAQYKLTGKNRHLQIVKLSDCIYTNSELKGAVHHFLI